MLIIFLLFALGWTIGGMVAAFTLVPIGIILFFGIPMTKKLTASGVLQKDNPIQKRYYISLLLLTVIYAAVLIATYFWLSNVFTGFLFGTGMALVFSLGKLGANPNNVSDYMETNKRYFTEKPTDAEL
ncbi:MAG: hypothetical protein Q7S50_02455 [bacterium]|nr:hypothetical protein [bacterium]